MSINFFGTTLYSEMLNWLACRWSDWQYVDSVAGVSGSRDVTRVDWTCSEDTTVDRTVDETTRHGHWSVSQSQTTHRQTDTDTHTHTDTDRQSDRQTHVVTSVVFGVYCVIFS